MKKIIPIAVLSWLVLFSNCSKDLPDPGATAAVSMANEWWVTFSQDGVDLLGAHVKVSSYNTATNDDSLWLDDLGNIWNFKCKTLANFQALTFSADSSQNDYYDIRVHIANGKIFKGGGVSKTGNKTDSIYMEASFGDDPGNYIYN